MATPAILRFELSTTENPLALMARLHPEGKTVLNRAEWRGKEPRSCGITQVRVRPYSAGSTEPKIVDVEVAYRPSGYINFVGSTKYDGWTLVVVDRKSDGTLLDGSGNPLPEGQSPVELRYEVYNDVDFDAIDFGKFVGESNVDGVKRITYDDVIQQIMQTGRWNASIQSQFMAPRRSRPSVKIVLSNSPSGTATDGFGTRIVNLNNFTPQLKQVVLNELTEIVSGFIEGRYSMKNVSGGDMVFAELSDVLVDCTPNEEGKESRFNCLKEYLPDSFLDDLAKRLSSTYEVDVSIVDGEEIGLFLKSSPPQKG